jgi:anti-sigma regulatory factor (Ser/Thr protein kinase)
MSSSSRSSVPSPSDHGDWVDVVVPSRAEYAATVRTVAAALAADAGFSIDEIDDVRLGLSEVFAAFVDGASSDGRLRVSFLASRGRLAAVTSSDDGSTVEFDELASNILQSVVDEFTAGPDGVHLVKHAIELGGAVGDGGSAGTG